MIIDTYGICTAIVNTLKSKIMGSVEANELQIYSLSNFSKNCLIYNQIAITKGSYPLPYVAVSTIGQNEKTIDLVAIDIDFAIPVDKIEEIIVDSSISYKNFEKLEEFANILIKLAQKACVNYPSAEVVFRPNAIETSKKEFSGNIQITYEKSIQLSRR